jgi:glycine cleavage system regulatory protein
MDRSFVFAIIGPDRPGLVEVLSDVVVNHDGNWLESRMASLADHFVGVARVTVPEKKAKAFALALTDLEATGLRVMLEPVGESGKTASRRLVIQVMGNDHPGIVREISRVLARHAANIVELDTGTREGAMSGETFFYAEAEVDVPPETADGALRADLEALSHEVMVDLTLEDRDF